MAALLKTFISCFPSAGFYIERPEGVILGEQQRRRLRRHGQAKEVPLSDVCPFPVPTCAAIIVPGALISGFSML